MLGGGSPLELGGGSTLELGGGSPLELGGEGGRRLLKKEVKKYTLKIIWFGVFITIEMHERKMKLELFSLEQQIFIEMTMHF